MAYVEYQEYLPRLCAALRKLGRADAAQILEMRTSIMWIKWLGHVPFPIDDSARCSEMLNASFAWSSTPEGRAFWEEVHDFLLRAETEERSG